MPGADGSDPWQIIGDPTEAALMVAAHKAGIDPAASDETLAYEIPFDSDRKQMSVIMRGPSGGMVLFSKGAPEVVLRNAVSEQIGGKIVPLEVQRRLEILAESSRMATGALRVLALAYRVLPPGIPPIEKETDLVLAGLVGMIDPPRNEAAIAVKECRAAGIRPVMITGDHP